jgi:hypothetical protein
MINSALENQAKSSDELMCRLIEERDRKKLADSDINPSSSCAINFAQTNLQISGTSVDSTTMPNPLAQLMNHFHNRTMIDGLTPTFWMPQQTTTSMLGQGYTHTAPSFFMPNFSSAPYTLGGNGRTYAITNGNYLIPPPGSLAGFLLNHAYHNATWFNAYDQHENDDFGYETPLQFPFRLQPIDMTPTRAMAELCTDPNNLTN